MPKVKIVVVIDPHTTYFANELHSSWAFIFRFRCLYSVLLRFEFPLRSLEAKSLEFCSVFVQLLQFFPRIHDRSLQESV